MGGRIVRKGQLEIVLRVVKQVCMNGVQEMKLGDICDSSPGRRNNFTIMEKDGMQPVKGEVRLQ